MEDDERAQLIEATRHVDEELRKTEEVRELLDATANRFKQTLELVLWLDVQRGLLGELLAEALDYLDRGEGAPADFMERARNVLGVMQP
jgi:hypothetical protein